MSANRNLNKVFGGAFTLTKATRSAALAIQSAQASKSSNFFVFIHVSNFIRQRFDY